MSQRNYRERLLQMLAYGVETSLRLLCRLVWGCVCSFEVAGWAESHRDGNVSLRR